MSFELFAETTRNDIVESHHFGAAAVCDAEGQILHQWGDVEQLIFPRSALKPLFAIGLIESGAADHFKLSQAELALACASHLGQAMHSGGVTAWLDRLGLQPDNLACGSVLPDDEQQLLAVLADGQGKCRIHHNCSGKHASFLTQSLFLNHSVQDFHLIEHPIQQASLNILSEMIDVDIHGFPMGIDGCGFPAPTMPLAKLAHLLASFATPLNQSVTRNQAVDHLHQAMTKNPFHVSGYGSVISDIMHVTNGKILVKSGAEGIMTAAIPSLGLGIALKIADGSARARGAVLLAIIKNLNILSSREVEQLQNHITPLLLNSRQEVVGEIRSTIYKSQRQLP